MPQCSQQPHLVLTAIHLLLKHSSLLEVSATSGQELVANELLELLNYTPIFLLEFSS